MIGACLEVLGLTFSWLVWRYAKRRAVVPAVPELAAGAAVAASATSVAAIAAFRASANRLVERAIRDGRK